MPLLERKQALLAKIETTYGVDATPTGAANAILVRNMKPTPMELEAESRALYLPYLGNEEDIVAAFYGMLEFEVEVAGAGALGTVPKYGPLLRGCALAEVVSAGVKVSYTPVSSGFESLSLYFHLDGVLHKMLGARGDVGWELNAKSVPVFKFKFMGLFIPVTDTALPTAVYAGFSKPVAVNKANTAYSLHGVTTPMTKLTMGVKNDVKYRNLVGYEGVDVVDRAPAGDVEFEAGLMATKNWFTVARDVVTDVLNVTHGTAPGNTVFITAPKTQITSPSYGETDGIAMISTGLKFMPNTGNDELLIEVR
jgi:hypothetical protein